ncbi:MAG: 3-phosphoshikimate 1-carboxyvinyltransferase [Bdellovibrionota bacterium]
MTPFRFRGTISSSKSILNRLLVIQSHAPSLQIVGDSKADDVVKMRSALASMLKGEPADCGSAGTTLRFLALRASRLQGTHHLSGSLRLFSRPHDEIVRLLAQLGREAEIRLQRLTVRGGDWTLSKSEVVVDRSISSQFASALFLNAWGLPFDLHVRFEGEAVSEPYFAMTLELVERAGMKIEKLENGTLRVPNGSRVTASKLESEIDLSSAFSLAALAAVSGGRVEIQDWPEKSLQPDRAFASILDAMDCEVTMRSSLIVSRTSGSPLKAIEQSMKHCPDLFPVLAVLCAYAEGTSRLSGAPHLAAKESDRIAKTAELLKALGRKARVIDGGLEIEGRPFDKSSAVKPFKYDTDHDHRLAMAAAVARAAGAMIELTDENVVNKSFPGFWTLFEEGLRG